MVKHPSYSFSLDSKTLYNSKEDYENYDLTSDGLWKDTRFLNYVDIFSKNLKIPKFKLNKLSRDLNPIELHLQTVFEILYNQKLHYTNPLVYDKSSATKRYYIKSLGLDLSLKLDQLIDDSNTSFEHKKIPEHWFSILPARSIEAKHKLYLNFKNLVSNSFNLLYKHWQNTGLLNDHGDVVEGVKPKYHTIAKNSLGKNIGVKSTPYLLLGRGCCLFNKLKYKFSSRFNAFVLHKEQSDFTYLPNNIPSIKFLYKVKSTLNKYGVAVVRNVFSKEQIKEIKSKLHLKSTIARDNAFKIIAIDPNVSTLKFTRGRINCILRGTSFNEALSPLQSFWMPFVYYSMKNDKKIFLSNLQLISSDPMSFVEPWHRDNRNAGISVVVPLQDTNKYNGRMQFIPGTHSDVVKVNSYTIGPIGVDLREGDMLIYNSSILHRNTINESDVCQSMIVFSYDYVDTPPPGQGLVKYIIDNFHGNAIVNLNKLFIDDVKHIGTHKFRFNDEILDLKQNVYNEKPRTNKEIKVKYNLEKAKEFFNKATLLKTELKKDTNHTQSIGYTVDGYPNPVTNPQLCIHTFYTKTYLCDPDGILSESEQEKINHQLINSTNNIFASLSHNILVESGKNKEETQLAFAKDLLKIYSDSVHANDKESVMLNYVKEFKSLKIVAGDDLLEKKLKKEFLTQLEKDFNEKNNETYQSLKKVIEELNSKLEKDNKGVIILTCLTVLFLLAIWGWYISRQFNSSDNN